VSTGASGEMLKISKRMTKRTAKNMLMVREMVLMIVRVVMMRA
jgi:hypothetical protein